MGNDNDYRDDDHWEYVHTSGSGGGNYTGSCSGEIFKCVLVVVVVLIVLALLLGVEIPGVVWKFFLEVVAVVGVFAWIGSWGKK